MPGAHTEGRHHAEDGTELAYAVSGQGPAMVLTNGLTTTGNFWKYLLPHWTRRYRVLTWDMPGHGDSGPACSEASATLVGQAPLVADLMDTAGMDRAVQVGWSTGCQVVLEFYRRYPERCQALVLLLGTAGNVLSNSKLPGRSIHWLARYLPPSVFVPSAKAFTRLSDTVPARLASRGLGLVGWGTAEGDAREITGHMRRLDAATVQTMVVSAESQSAWALLPEIRCPVLIVLGERDPFAPADRVAERMASAIPQATLVRLPRGTHTALLDQATPIRAAVDAFLGKLAAGLVPSRTDGSPRPDPD